eukprot:8691717-Pyramimonas_sp.AAC.1
MLGADCPGRAPERHSSQQRPGAGWRAPGGQNYPNTTPKMNARSTTGPQSRQRLPPLKRGHRP